MDLVLLEEGHNFVVLDDFSNGSPIALERVTGLAIPAQKAAEGVSN